MGAAAGDDSRVTPTVIATADSAITAIAPAAAFREAAEPKKICPAATPQISSPAAAPMAAPTAPEVAASPPVSQPRTKPVLVATGTPMPITSARTVRRAVTASTLEACHTVSRAW